MASLIERTLLFLVSIPIYLVSLLPLRVHYAFADLFHFLLYRVIRYRRSVITINLARSFPDKKYPEIERIAKEFYRYFLDIFVEMIWAYSRSSEKVNRRVVMENPEVIQKLYAQGKNVVAVLGHYGNWELCCSIGPYNQLLNIDIQPSENFFIYKKQKGLSDRLVRMLREKKGVCTLLESGQVFRHVMQNRNGKGIYFFIADQSPKHGAKYGLKFLNQPTLMINGPEYMATKLGLPMFYVSIDRYERGRYRFRFTEITPDASKEEPGWVTRRFAALLEESIRNNPACWLWSHKRWKRWITEEEKLIQYFE